jgi:DNA-binding MarR family transcriptional regulator
MRLVEITVTRPHIAWQGGYPFVLASNVDHLDAKALAWCERWHARANDDPVPVDLDAIDAELDAEEAAEPSTAVSVAALEPVAASPVAPGRPSAAETQALVLEAIREAGEIGASELARRLALEPAPRKRALTRLMADGLVEAKGATRARVYRFVVPGLTSLTRVPKTNGKPAPTIEGRVLVAVLYRRGTVAELAARLELDPEVVAAALRKLEREGEVRACSGNGLPVWGRG